MQAYEIQKLIKTRQLIDIYNYKKNCETFYYTATLLIHNLKYFSLVSLCFTEGKNIGRV